MLFAAPVVLDPLGSELLAIRDGFISQQIYGSFGSRLHQEADGRFVAYAEWPDQATWQRAIDARMAYDEPETRAAFVDAIAETPPGNLPVFTMHVTDDLLSLRGA